MRTIETSDPTIASVQLKSRWGSLLRTLWDLGNRRAGRGRYIDVAELSPHQLKDISGQESQRAILPRAQRQDLALQEARQRAFLLALGTGGR
ncbi:hypothetical protein ACFSE1_12160 [Rhizobium helianthi]|uniref:Uncharacterized protein n=1 Tax=Rhizobium helianthi TaxID=1132695 RepID=A0ABW4M6Q5_9HYPH